MSQWISCFWMRGGTSKGGCFLQSQLGATEQQQNARLSQIFGSPDSSGRQIDGMGGGTSTTSKAVIIARRENEKNSIDYTFAQVDIKSNLVDRKSNCGNMSTVAAPFAIEMDLIDELNEPITQVKVFNTNSQKTIVAHVPVKNGKVVYHGDYAISGVPGQAAKIKLEFLQPAGAVTQKLLPTGNAVDQLDVEGYGKITVSIVDAATTLVFVRAEDLDLVGNEMPWQIDDNQKLLDKLLAIRCAASVVAGISPTIEQAAKIPAVPKFCFISSAGDYTDLSGNNIKQSDIDLQARMLSMGKLHPALAITGGVCIGVAAKVPGTLVNQMIADAMNKDEIRIGHCGGLLSVGSQVVVTEGNVDAVSGTVYRTARILMRGEVAVD